MLAQTLMLAALFPSVASAQFDTARSTGIAGPVFAAIQVGNPPQFVVEISTNLRWPFHNPDFKLSAQSIAIFRTPRRKSDVPVFTLNSWPELRFERAELNSEFGGLWLVYQYRDRIGQPYRQIRKGQLLVLRGERLEPLMDIDIGRTYREWTTHCSSTATWKRRDQLVDVRWVSSGVRWDGATQSTKPFSNEESFTLSRQGDAYAPIYPESKPVSGTSPEEIRALLTEIQPVISQSPCARDDLWKVHAPRLESAFRHLGHEIAIDGAGDFGTYAIYLAQFTMPDEVIKKLAGHRGVSTREEWLKYLLDDNPLNAMPWDQKLWLSPESRTSKKNVRYRLFKDLSAKRKIIGMRKSELLELLGKPDSVDDLGLSYRLGLQPGFIRLDDISLHFMIDEDKVAGYSFRKGG